MSRYVVTVDYGDEIVEYEGELFANNERHVVLDTSSGRVWIGKSDTRQITFEEADD
jgi:hypothetical protein